MNEEVTVIQHKDLKPLADFTLLVYIAQAVGCFLPIGFIVGIVLNYIRKDDVADTWLASHFRWQIRTFWYGLLWAVIGSIALVIVIGQLILLAGVVWVIYRIAKGWLYLSEKREMYP